MGSLRPSSVCDTTPLQRLESNSTSSEEPSSPIFHGTSISIGSQTTLGTDSLNSGITTLPPLSVSADSNSSAVLIQTPTILPSSNHNNNNNNNNINNINNKKSIEIRLNHSIDNSHKNLFTSSLVAGGGSASGGGGVGVGVVKTNTRHISSEDKKFNMHYTGTRHILARLLMDMIILGFVALPIVAFNIWGEPFKKGFFCEDESLKHPYKDSTIHSWMLYLVCLIIPISLITAVEFFRANCKRMQGFDQITTNQYYLCHLEIPDWITECYKKIGILIFGCGVEQLTIEIAKFSVGRLRPHFFAVCQPLMFDGTTCDDPINRGRYIEDYTCMGIDVTSKMLKEVSLSFPSGHASFSFFTMIYIAVYLQKRMTWKRGKMWKHLLQFVFLMFAWYTALTRVSDYKHHWTDVLAGASIGTIYAFIVTMSVW